MPGKIACLVPDILIEMRIDAVARALDADLEPVQSPEHLEKALSGASVLVVDLAVAGLDLDWVVKTARSRGVPVIAFGPHVDQELLAAAAAAGMDEVYPRSAFMSGMGRILGARLGGEGRGD